MLATRPPAATASSRAPRPIAGVGRVMLWSGGSLWIGRQAGLARRHAHHAIQIALALRGCFRMSDEQDAGWREHAGAIVMPHRRHQFDGCGADVAMIFVEPETVQGRALVARHAARAVTPIEPALLQRIVAPLREGFDAGVDNAALASMACDAVSMLVGAAPAGERVEPRIERSIAWLRGRLAGSITLADAAAQAHLSPSRFRHLFVAQTGVSFRAYVLWARVASAMGAGMSGQSWTAAAQEAGFADSAHLSRTCRRMFGIAPAMLVKAEAHRSRQ
jgi:AraC-like DNA-binding protein